ncbi:MAG: DMT family transporter [Verrucomicrobia bacterium]|nr:MAG: DMT family transporter [Verrucomicrobiota bacterium]TAE86107.1 MAG: DMT family transporter [Verrucomicrobiota bacterium]TAF23454.1 MAG: DMT family transporter [Verrucomicrobiota bacterium]TAF40084.1 MAG: DMT family transporter [Verrucomicrobiota bacterium]
MPAALLVLACVLWGLSFPIIKALDLVQSERLPHASKEFLAAWLQSARFGLAALIMSPLMIHLRPNRRELTQGAWLALWGGLGMALQAWGLAFTTASTSAFLTQAHCVFLPLVACLKSRRLPTARTLAATTLVLGGVAILSGVHPGRFQLGKGETLTLLAAFVFTFQILTLENPRHQGNRGIVVTFVMCSFIALIFFPIAAILAPNPHAMLDAGRSAPVLLLITGLALLCSVAAFSLMNTWQPQVSATEAGLIYTMEPVFTALFALFLPAWLALMTGSGGENESLTSSSLIGGALILTANLIVQWRRPPHPPAISPMP